MPARSREAPRAAAGLLGPTLCGIAVILVYVWIISVGRWSDWPPTTNYYDQLATAFGEGRLNIEVAQDASFRALLELPDPYEPDARSSIRAPAGTKLAFRDMSLYEGKLYLYWGPAPALLLAGAKLLYPVAVGDQTLAFIFAIGLFGFESAILVRARQRFFANLPAWTLLPALVVVGLISPIPAMLAKPRIYEAAILGDQFFFIGGLYFALIGLERIAESVRLFVLAGVFWAFAVGSRVTMAPPICLLALALLVWFAVRGRTAVAHVGVLAPALALIVPLVLGALLLGWYNAARFGSVFEFGFRYAITMLNQHEFYDRLFAGIYVLPNAYIYLLNPPELSGTFPFVATAYNAGLVQEFNSRFAAIYNVEKIVGLLYAAPFSLLALVPSALIFADRLPVGARGKTSIARALPAGQLRFMLGAISLALLLELLVIFLIFYASMRYMLDAVPSLALLSVFGFWQLHQLLAQRPAWQTAYVVTAVSLVVITVLVSLLLSFSTDPDWIRLHNPRMLSELRRLFTP